MEPGFKPKWTKQDTRDCVWLGAGLVALGGVCGFLSREGLVWGAIGGGALWAIITMGALAKLAYGRLRS